MITVGFIVATFIAGFGCGAFVVALATAAAHADLDAENRELRDQLIDQWVDRREGL